MNGRPTFEAVARSLQRPASRRRRACDGRSAVARGHAGQRSSDHTGTVAMSATALDGDAATAGEILQTADPVAIHHGLIVPLAALVGAAKEPLGLGWYVGFSAFINTSCVT